MHSMEEQIQELQRGLGTLVEALSFVQNFLESDYGLKYQFFAYCHDQVNTGSVGVLDLLKKKYPLGFGPDPLDDVDVGVPRAHAEYVVESVDEEEDEEDEYVEGEESVEEGEKIDEREEEVRIDERINEIKADERTNEIKVDERIKEIKEDGQEEEEKMDGQEEEEKMDGQEEDGKEAAGKNDEEENPQSNLMLDAQLNRNNYRPTPAYVPMSPNESVIFERDTFGDMRMNQQVPAPRDLTEVEINEEIIDREEGLAMDEDRKPGPHDLVDPDNDNDIEFAEPEGVRWKSKRGKRKKLRNSDEFRCLHCNRRCSDEASLEEHLLHHKQQFQCSECRVWLSDKSTLRRHMRSHLGVRPFECNFCGDAFTRQDIFKKHVQRKHKNMIQNSGRLKKK